MLSAWVAIGLYLPKEHQRVFPILLVSFSESDDSFPGQFSFGHFWNTWFVHVWLQLCRVKQVFIIWSLIFFNPIIFICRSTVYKFRLWHFYDENCFISKICFEFFKFTYILNKKALSTINFLNAMTSMMRKRLITFYFR